MCERREDDTTERRASERSERAPGSYYYDDATGYEIYAPSEDEEADGEPPREE